MSAVTYEEAVFSAEDRGAPSRLDLFCEYSAACYHEAGHAVVGYMLGRGLARVEVQILSKLTDDGQPGVAVGGCSFASKRARAARKRDARKYGYCRAVLTASVEICAGPVAEYRFCTELGMPRRLLLSADGDHEYIDRLATDLESG